MVVHAGALKLPRVRRIGCEHGRDEARRIAASAAKRTELLSKDRPAKWCFNRRCRGDEHTAQEA